LKQEGFLEAGDDEEESYYDEDEEDAEDQDEEDVAQSVSVAENVTDNNKGGNNDEEVEIQKIKIVKGKVKETIEQMSTDQKL
jgi:hypothetical protein